MVKKASEVEFFPYNSRHNCYMVINDNGKLEQIQHGVDNMKELYEKVKNNDSDLYIVWPGRYRSDLFIVDNLELFAEAFKIII
ncbi:hypothetical protein G7059_08905 [Erysipelothrix sp. HDW6A]|uniref:hypothetical protein n=1 Tax=Erysipelothrix sp. HDW6A TaxID=2714928 RepID=UPI00140A101C|nr:hypothetical protein [Erysipelothrix sp. HDW6A]QIK57953.1 hypothetical protein G7059_08905 [Erysipelothrix sp. HDW6A]